MDPFDGVCLFEDTAAEAGRSDGFLEGQRTGYARGYSYGIPQGAALGAELGLIRATVSTVTNEYNHNRLTTADDLGARQARILQLGLDLIQLVDTIPLSNPKAPETVEKILRVQARFRLFAALARLPQATRTVFPIQPAPI